MVGATAGVEPMWGASRGWGPLGLRLRLRWRRELLVMPEPWWACATAVAHSTSGGDRHIGLLQVCHVHELLWCELGGARWVL